MIQKVIFNHFRALQKVSEEELAAEGNTGFDKLNAWKFRNLWVIQAFLGTACDHTRTQWCTPP